MGSGFSKLKKQAKQFGAQYEKMQEEMRRLQVIGSAGNGLVTLVLNGEYEMQEIKIKPECLSDIEGLQDLIMAAYSDAAHQIKAQNQQGMEGFPFG